MGEICKYRIMWLIVFFDLPTNSAKDKKEYIRFRKFLLEDGFTMMQYSVYIRHSASRENAEVHINRIKSSLPENGTISVLIITDKQFGDIQNFWGRKTTKPPLPTPKQLEMF
ncbi:MAG: CRISPR-associated endonuclease Cas2 [Nitrospirae bacterium]|nr:CRISPR-associated endonuclease Cas2 [Nitrospirota bacterium]